MSTTLKCKTGEISKVPQTATELAEADARRVEIAAREAEEAAKKEKKEKALDKLRKSSAPDIKDLLVYLGAGVIE